MKRLGFKHAPRDCLSTLQKRGDSYMKNYPLREADYSSCVELADVALRNVTRHPDTRSKEMAQRRVAWSHAYKDGELGPLCYEHHPSMTFAQVAPTSRELTPPLRHFSAEPASSSAYC